MIQTSIEIIIKLEKLGTTPIQSHLHLLQQNKLFSLKKIKLNFLFYCIIYKSWTNSSFQKKIWYRSSVESKVFCWFFSPGTCFQVLALNLFPISRMDGANNYTSFQQTLRVHSDVKKTCLTVTRISR